MKKIFVVSALITLCILVEPATPVWVYHICKLLGYAVFAATLLGAIAVLIGITICTLWCILHYPEELRIAQMYALDIKREQRSELITTMEICKSHTERAPELKALDAEIAQLEDAVAYKEQIDAVAYKEPIDAAAQGFPTAAIIFIVVALTAITIAANT